MNIPKYSLENRKVIYFFLAILLIGGVISFFKLPKKEDAFRDKDCGIGYPVSGSEST